MSIQSGITQGTPAKILFGAGVYFQGVTYDEKTAPTEEAIKAALKDYFEKNNIPYDKKQFPDCENCAHCHE